jgi:hypothetical protein
LQIPVIASPGQVITTAASYASSFNGLLVDEIADVQAITHELSNGNSYTVPSGMKLYILNHFSPNDRLIIDDITINLGSNEYSSHSPCKSCNCFTWTGNNYSPLLMRQLSTAT